MTDDQKLKLRKCPCPADIDCVSVQHVGRQGVWDRSQVQCGACGRRGPIVETDQEAIDLWNTPSPAVTELVEMVEIQRDNAGGDWSKLEEVGTVCYCDKLRGPENDPDYGDDSVMEPTCICCLALQTLCSIYENLDNALKRIEAE